MTTWESHAPAGHYRFRQVARMEWIKLWSLRSTWWTLAITFAGAVVAFVGLVAPHLVRPLPFLVPVYRGSKRGLITVRIGMWLYDLLTPGRERERFRVVRAVDALALEPSIQALSDAQLRAKTDEFRARLAARTGH